MSKSMAIRKLNEETWELCFRDTPRALRRSARIRQLAEERSDRSGLGYSLRNAGVCHWILGDYATALDELEQANRLFHELGDRHGESSALNWIGNLYWRQNDYQNSLKFHIQTLNLRKELGDEIGQAGSLNNIGLNYYDLGQYDVALEYHLQSLQLYESNNAREGMGKALNNLANIYEKLGDDEKTLEFNFKSLKLKQEANNRVEEAGSLTNIGNVYRRLKNYEQAVEYHTRSYVISHEMNHRSGEALSLLNLGSVYEDIGLHEKAFDNLQKSLKTFREIGDKYYEAETLINLAGVLQKQDQYEAALADLHTALQIAEELGLSEILYQTHRALSEAYEAVGDAVEALSHLKECIKYRETIYGVEAERKIKSLIVKSEIEKAQQEAEIYRLRNVELARTYQELQRADEQKTELLKQLRLKSEELERLSFEDGLTGLHNRRYLDARLHDEFIRSRRLHHDLTVVMLDIDNFKSINDRFTHETGDKVLKTAAALLQRNVREIDAVSRYGGEEFLIILVETDSDKASEVCERIRQEFIAYAWTELHPFLHTVTVSQGFCSDGSAVSAKAVVEIADQHLYRAKQNGRNRVCGKDE